VPSQKSEYLQSLHVCPDIFCEHVLVSKFAVKDLSNNIISFEENFDVEVTNIFSNVEAYVTIIPGSGRGFVTSNFKLHVPVDPRPFEWTPQQLNSHLNRTEAIIKKFDSGNNAVKPGKYLFHRFRAFFNIARNLNLKKSPFYGFYGLSF